ncbi:Hypothetical protein R9X50_00069300 [Acrodontium crateriforme]|uniref:DUF6604 domain-containing protein n=1 Tax=Acrodontium crateriforme TaxID=150365 RepID=A0AAQ3M132_9PEZI|nr:Hypothetical protein R9X50_00069300 [Acrodontium crateriforme]
MAPSAAGPYINTYKVYKEGTARLTTWLVSTARKVGVDVDSYLTIGPNGKRQSTIPIKAFRQLATAIAASESPKIELPASMATLIRSVIGLRQRANSFFVKVSQGASSVVDDGHRHFIGVLKEVLSILSPQATNDDENEHDASVANLFELLTLEEPTETEATSTSKKAPKNAESFSYNVDQSDLEAESIFALFAFFNDVNEIRDHVQKLWADYRDSKIDSMAVAVTTDTAFMMLRKMSEEIPNSIVGDLNYPQITRILTDHLAKTGGATEAFADFVCIRAAGIINSYEDVLSPTEIPILKPGHFGHYRPHQDRSKLSDNEQYREDLIILMELLPEFTTLSRARMHVPAEDELTIGLRKMMEANEMSQLPMYAIFATQILLDIHHVLRQHASRPFDEFQASARRAVVILNDYFQYSRNRRTPSWSPKDEQVLHELLNFAKDWGTTDRLTKAKRTLMTTLPVEPEPFKLLRGHPVLAGLLNFRLNQQMNEAGIFLCNAWGSVIYPAHLYNACENSAGLGKQWPDMDFVISVHSKTRIFVGAPPTGPQEYWKRFALALGTSATAFARNRRGGTAERIPESKKGPRGLKTTSPVRDIFRDRYLKGTPAVLSRANIAAMLAVATKAQRTSPPSIDLVEFSHQTAAQPNFSLTQLLIAVREGMIGEELHLKFDYFGLHQRGFELLKKLQNHLQDQMVQYFGSDYIEQEFQLPFIVGYIFEVVRGSDRIAQQFKDVESGSRMLQAASEVLAQYLEEKGDGSITKAAFLTAALQNPA